jgi:hypothetical protein
MELASCVLPKPVPEIITLVVAGPEVGEIPETLGSPVTEKLIPFDSSPFADTTTFPVVAPLGTVAVT